MILSQHCIDCHFANIESGVPQGVVIRSVIYDIKTKKYKTCMHLIM